MTITGWQITNEASSQGVKEVRKSYRRVEKAR